MNQGLDSFISNGTFTQKIMCISECKCANVSMSM